MIRKYYKIKVKGKNVRRFIKTLYMRKVNLNSIEIGENFFTAIVDSVNLEKILNIKTYYKIEIIDSVGFLHFKNLIKENSAFLFSFLIGILFFSLLSNIIFDVVVVTDDSEIKKIIVDELYKNNIKKYSFVKSYKSIQEIKSKLLDSFNDKIEWLEIERIGTSYYVRLEKRIIKDLKTESKFRHVIAKRDGIIKKIVAHDGEIVTKTNDYVSKGTLLISGEIHKGEDIKGNIPASGDVYAEVWYKVKVTLPINYYEKKYTGNNKNVINFRFLNNSYNVFDNNKYIDKDTESFNIYSDFFNLCEINYNKENELYVNDSVNLITSEVLAVKYAKDKILSRLNDGEYIISQKKLKTILNDSTISVEVFFKVYENISSFEYYEIERE